jgi:hypothetical protein
MKALRNIITKITWGTLTPMDLIFPGDTTCGSVHLCDDSAGRPITLDEVSIRAMLHRVGPLCADKTGPTTITVDAWSLVEAIEHRSQPIHQPIPNKIAAAPLRDRFALKHLRNEGYVLASRCCDAKMTLNVPEGVASWIGIRHRKALTSLEAMCGWGPQPICA